MLIDTLGAPASPAAMPDEAVLYWEKMIRLHGRVFGESRHIGKDFQRCDSSWVSMGGEYQPPDAPYCWHGLKRRIKIQKRWLAFQWTLEGEGALRVGDT